MADKNSRVLVISDQHLPYNHPDLVAFLKAIKAEYKPDRVINIGDEIDGHSYSFHEHSPDLLSPGAELQSSITRLKVLYKLFPNVDVMESNHGSLIYRKGSAAGIPLTAFKSYRDMLEAPATWKWHMDLTLKLSNGASCYFHHGKTGTPGKLSKNMGMNAVQGHHHSRFQITYWANPVGIFWDMHVGFLADSKSIAQAYAKNNVDRGIVGTGIILNGYPRLLPMVLNSSGRWTGKLV